MAFHGLVGYFYPTSSNIPILSSCSFNPLILFLNLPFLTSSKLLSFHPFIVDIFSYIPLHPFNHTNYVYLIIIMSSLHHIISLLLHIFYIVFLIYLSPIKLLLLCLTLPQLFYNFPCSSG